MEPVRLLLLRLSCLCVLTSISDAYCFCFCDQKGPPQRPALRGFLKIGMFIYFTTKSVPPGPFSLVQVSVMGFLQKQKVGARVNYAGALDFRGLAGCGLLWLLAVRGYLVVNRVTSMVHTYNPASGTYSPTYNYP